MADYKTECSAEILFVPESLSRYPTESGKSWKGTAGTLEGDIGETIKREGIKIGSFYPQMKAESQCYREDAVNNTLVNGTNPGFHNGVVTPTLISFVNRGHSRTDEVSETIRSECHGDVPCVLVAFTDGKAYELGALSRGQGGERAWKVSPTLREKMGDNLPTVIVLQDKCIGRKEKNTGNGLGATEGGPCYTLTGTDVHAVVAPIMLENHPNDSRVKIDNSGNTQTLTERMGTGGGNTPMVMIPIYCIDRAAFNQSINAQYDISITDNDVMQTIVAKGPNAVGVPSEITLGELIAIIEYIVRRLMPGECAELQGFPFDWHEGVNDEKGKPMKDSPAYKGYGNAVATVVAEYPIQNIINNLRKEHEQCEKSNEQS